MSSDKSYRANTFGTDAESEIEESSATVSEPEYDSSEFEDDMDALIDAASEEVTEELRTTKVVQLLPVHAAPNTGKNPLRVQRQRGRPRKVERMPTTSDLEYHARMTEQKARFITGDPIVRAATAHADAADMLHSIKLEVAKETAALHFQRIENEKHGKDTAQVSTRRIDALKKIAELELEIRKLGADMIDLKGEKMQRVFSYFIQQIKETAGETLAPEAIDLFFNRLQTALDGWEDKCAELVSSEKNR